MKNFNVNLLNYIKINTLRNFPVFFSMIFLSMDTNNEWREFPLSLDYELWHIRSSGIFFILIVPLFEK